MLSEKKDKWSIQPRSLTYQTLFSKLKLESKVSLTKVHSLLDATTLVCEFRNASSWALNLGVSRYFITIEGAYNIGVSRYQVTIECIYNIGPITMEGAYNIATCNTGI